MQTMHHAPTDTELAAIRAPVPTTVTTLAAPATPRARRPGRTHRPPLNAPSKPMTYRLTASLVAARLEADDAIHLRIADPISPRTMLLVSFPSTARGTVGGDPAMHDQLRAARRAFIEGIVLPPFEAPALLYGTAELTLVGGDEREGGDDGEGVRGASLRVLEFEALESSAPPAGVCDRPRPARRGWSGTVGTDRRAA